MQVYELRTNFASISAIFFKDFFIGVFMDFVKFLNDNSLRKKEIAEYLEVVPSVVSDICRGRIGLSPKNREKLEANDKGWDLSALGEPAKPMPYVHAKASGSGHNVATVSLGGERDRIVSLEAENALLRTQVTSLEAQLANCWALINKLTK